MSNEWKMVKLGDVCTIVRGASPRPIDKFITNCNDGINWIKIGDANEKSKYITETKQRISVAGAEKSRYVRKGDFILSNSMSFGRPYIMAIDGCVHDGWLIISDYDNSFIKDYLYYLLNSTGVYNQFAKFASGGVVNNLNSNIVRNISVLTYSLEKQREIAAVLDKASELVEKRKAQLDELDRLAESIFYDMFGDPVTNPKGWNVSSLKSLTTKIGSGATPKGGNENYKNEGISLIRSLNVHNAKFKYKDLAFIDETQASALDGVTVEQNDVLLNITGASVARCCIVPNDILPARVNQHVAILRVKKDRLNFRFLCNVLISNEYQNKLLKDSKSNGATREALTKSNLEDLIIITPPLEIQQQFAERIEKIEEQKAKVQTALKESEDLFQRLMQDMFKPGNDNS